MTDYIKYLIVPGTNKSGSSSIYNYLANHPGICPSLGKQADYFLSEDYPWSVDSGKPRFTDAEGEAYTGCFQQLTPLHNYRLDVSPDYMYCMDSAHSIAQVCGAENVKILFLLRDPVARFDSWYRFSKQQGLIGSEVNYNEFLSIQSSVEGASLVESILETGRYSAFIEPYIRVFGPNNVEFCFYEDLEADPKRFMSSICTLMEIDPEFYGDFTFKHYNRTQGVRHRYLHTMYVAMYRRLQPILQGNLLISKIVGPAARFVAGIYRKGNMRDQEETMPHSVELALKAEYASEYEALSSMGVKHSWS